MQSANELEIFAAAIDAGFDSGKYGLEEHRILYSRTKNKKTTQNDEVERTEDSHLIGRFIDVLYLLMEVGLR